MRHFNVAMQFSQFIVFLMFVSMNGDVESSVDLSVDASGNESIEKNMTRLLSRRKRYLLFPDGSSFQLVFCTQQAALIPIGDIFLFGSTLAFAWELPKDPKFLYMFKNLKVDSNRRADGLNDMYYLDSNGKIVAKVPFKRKTFFKPIFAKRSVLHGEVRSLNNRVIEINRKQMHDRQMKREFLNREHMDESSVQFHRESRVGLFEKLEMLFTGFGWNGRECILKKICESRHRNAPQGSFLQEILRIVFTLPKGSSTNDVNIDEDYDLAHTKSGRCDVLYPNCPEIDATNNVQLTFNNNYLSY